METKQTIWWKIAGLATTLLLLAVGCRKAGAAMPTELLYVDEVVGPQQVKTNETVVLSIHGNYPDPSWVWDSNVITQQQSTITIEVFGKKKKVDAVAMVLVPFTTTATLATLPVGQVLVVVKGRQKSIQHELTVTP
ncbi:MAG: hypothetical protein HY692_00255 [Cyanobacteria bacterium NC_groundwater_1444_Ag_S-0.65um_54_12]|nr:hypothetical protein [Cyanobacteria bacterium NC_groundwater_1444_Ag_S-0.65um_54_12]